MSISADRSDSPFDRQQVNALSTREEHALNDGEFLGPIIDAYAEKWEIHRRVGHLDPVTDKVVLSIAMEHACLETVDESVDATTLGGPPRCLT